MLLSCDKQMKDSFASTVIMASRKESIQRELKTWFKTGLFFLPNEKKGRINTKRRMKREESQNLTYSSGYKQQQCCRRFFHVIGMLCKMKRICLTMWYTHLTNLLQTFYFLYVIVKCKQKLRQIIEFLMNGASFSLFRSTKRKWLICI